MGLQQSISSTGERLVGILDSCLPRLLLPSNYLSSLFWNPFLSPPPLNPPRFPPPNPPRPSCLPDPPRSLSPLSSSPLFHLPLPPELNLPQLLFRPLSSRLNPPLPCPFSKPPSLLSKPPSFLGPLGLANLTIIILSPIFLPLRLLIACSASETEPISMNAKPLFSVSSGILKKKSLTAPRSSNSFRMSFSRTWMKGVLPSLRCLQRRPALMARRSCRLLSRSPGKKLTGFCSCCSAFDKYGVFNNWHALIMQFTVPEHY